MEHGGGAPAGASSDMGQVSATFEAGFEQGTVDVSGDTSLVQTAESGGDSLGMADSHDESKDEGFGLIEGQEVDFNNKNEPEEEVIADVQVSEPEMDPDESIKIAKNEGFEPALEYYASFGSDNTSGEAEIEDQVNDIDQDPIVNEITQDEEIPEEDQPEGEDTEAPESQDEDRIMSQENLTQNPEVMNMLDQMKKHNEMFRMLIERLEKQQQITAEMLAMMAVIMKEALENKKDKNEEDEDLMSALTRFIGFLMGMLFDPERESQKIEQKAA